MRVTEKVLLKGNRDPLPRWHVGQTCERRDAAKWNSDRIHSKVTKLLHKCSENLATIRWEMKCESENSPVRTETTALKNFTLGQNETWFTSDHERMSRPKKNLTAVWNWTKKAFFSVCLVHNFEGRFTLCITTKRALIDQPIPRWIKTLSTGARRHGRVRLQSDCSFSTAWSAELNHRVVQYFTLALCGSPCSVPLRQRPHFRRRQNGRNAWCQMAAPVNWGPLHLAFTAWNGTQTGGDRPLYGPVDTICWIKLFIYALHLPHAAVRP